MANSSILGGEKAPAQAQGRGADALGPSDSSDSGSDVQGERRGIAGETGDAGGVPAELGSDTDAAGTGERGGAIGVGAQIEFPRHEVARGWHGTDHQRHDGVLAHAPGKAKECEHKDADQHQNLELENEGTGGLGKGYFADDLGGLVGRAEQRKKATDHQDRGRGKKRRCL